MHKEKGKQNVSITPAVFSSIKLLWDYNCLSQPPRAADFLLVMGSSDTGVAAYAASIDKMFHYQLIIVSGGMVHQKSRHNTPYAGIEADVLSNIMVEKGVERARIILEDKAMNSGDNLLFTKELLERMAIVVKTGHIVHKPTAQRRALATAQKQWPEIDWSVSAQDVSLSDYMSGINEESFLNGIVGETAKTLYYPYKGFHIVQDVPEAVKHAMYTLIAMGYDKGLPEDFPRVLAK